MASSIFLVAGGDPGVTARGSYWWFTPLGGNISSTMKVESPRVSSTLTSEVLLAPGLLEDSRRSVHEVS